MRIRPDESYDEYAARMAGKRPPRSYEEEYQRRLEAKKREEAAEEERRRIWKKGKIRSYDNAFVAIYKDLVYNSRLWDKEDWKFAAIFYVPMFLMSAFAAFLFIAWFVMLVQNPGVGSKTTDELRRERWEYEMEQDRIENQRIQEERAYKDLKSMTK